MADVDNELNERFGSHNAFLTSEVLGELQSILRLHSISPQELFYKWESYSLKMGAEDVKLNLKTARDFKKDIQEGLERDSRGKMHVRSVDKKGLGSTPRTASKPTRDVFGLMDGIVPETPRLPMRGVNGNSTKRKGNFETPLSKASKAHATSSPGEQINPQGPLFGQILPFSQRPNIGKIDETLNSHIKVPHPPAAPFTEPRIKLKANTDLVKFSYKPMAMKLSAASEILDDRIDGFADLVQLHHKIEDSEFGNPANESTTEIVAVGRIALDASEGKLNSASIVLETSRRTGAGLRVPLKLESLPYYELFPGKIVALRGSNASGDYFTVSEILDIPLLDPAASTVTELDYIRAKVAGGADISEEPHPLNIMVSSGPYTADNNLEFEPLQELCERAATSAADAVILLGPFLDVEHPLITSGEIPDLPSTLNVNPDTATLTDVFRALISLPLQRLAQAVPSITIVMVPSVRDAVNRHLSWPQDRLNRKELGLPKQVACVPNPVTLTLNEFVVAISSHEILYELQREECKGGNLPPESQNLLARLSKHVIQQRHFYPLFPATARENLPKPSVIDGAQRDGSDDRKATGAMLDISYLQLGDWQGVRPDVLILPSALAPFAKVVESVLVINPGTLSKRRGPGTFAQMTVEAHRVTQQEREAGDLLGHKMFERTRVDVIKI